MIFTYCFIEGGDQDHNAVNMGILVQKTPGIFIFNIYINL